MFYSRENPIPHLPISVGLLTLVPSCGSHPQPLVTARGITHNFLPWRISHFGMMGSKYAKLEVIFGFLIQNNLKNNSIFSDIFGFSSFMHDLKVEVGLGHQL